MTNEALIERVARAIWRDLYGKRGEEHAFEFHTQGETEALSAAKAAIEALQPPEHLFTQAEQYVIEWDRHGRVNSLRVPEWEKSYQDAGAIEEARRQGYIWIDGNVACDVTLTAMGELLVRLAKAIGQPPEPIQDGSERLRQTLWLFREFVIRNATQWQVGAGHHHPIWAMVAELVSEEGGIVSGPFYEFIQPENRDPLPAAPNPEVQP